MLMRIKKISPAKKMKENYKSLVEITIQTVCRGLFERQNVSKFLVFVPEMLQLLVSRFFLLLFADVPTFCPNVITVL